VDMSTIGRRALITGITGQDGSYLAEMLLARGCEVHGIVRRASTFNTARLDHLYRDPHERGVRLHLHHGDMTDAMSVAAIIERIRPHEVYHLAAQSHVRVSFDQPVHTAQVIAIGTLNLLEALRGHRDRTGDDVRLVHASSSEMFGSAVESPQAEQTPFRPRSPYGCAKVMAHHSVVNYREAHGLHASCAIMFNHESPRRGETFVTRKITRAAARISLGLQRTLYLGNLDAQRDWGFAGEYVKAMWLMARLDAPDDFIIATGRSMRVREFASRAFARLGLNADDHIEIDPRYQRPAEVENLCGDATKARRMLGWRPRVGIDQLIDMMVDHDLALAGSERRGEPPMTETLPAALTAVPDG